MPRPEGAAANNSLSLAQGQCEPSAAGRGGRAAGACTPLLRRLHTSAACPACRASAPAAGQLQRRALGDPDKGWWPPSVVAKGAGVQFTGGAPLAVGGRPLPGYAALPGRTLLEYGRFACNDTTECVPLAWHGPSWAAAGIAGSQAACLLQAHSLTRSPHSPPTHTRSPRARHCAGPASRNVSARRRRRSWLHSVTGTQSARPLSSSRVRLVALCHARSSLRSSCAPAFAPASAIGCAAPGLFGCVCQPVPQAAVPARSHPPPPASPPLLFPRCTQAPSPRQASAWAF